MLYFLYVETKTVSMSETRNALFKMFLDLTIALFLGVNTFFFSGSNHFCFEFRLINLCSCIMAIEI